MRPDHIINGEISLFPQPAIKKTVHPHSTIDYRGQTIHLRNNPELLFPKFRLSKEQKSDEEAARGAELFRCYAGTICYLSEEMKKRMDCFNDDWGLAFPLTDMTLFLLCPQDIAEYVYSKEELILFGDKLKRELESI